MKKRKISRKDAWRIVLLLILVILLLGWFSRRKMPLSGAAAKHAVPSATVQTASHDEEGGGSGRSVRTSGPTVMARATNVPGRLELPGVEDSTFFLEDAEGRYAMLYDTLYRQAAWVAYRLTRREAEYKGTERTNRFVPDPKVKERGWPTAVASDYTRSGYDRGHLLPSADRDDDSRENAATFYLSNISPQRPALNRRIWKNLEEQVRCWAVSFDTVYVVTGGVLTPGVDRIKGGVGVPGHFFKVLLVRCGGQYRCAGFLIPNRTEIPGGYSDYLVPVAEIENLTGYDFFPSLPDSIENRIEARTDRSFWRIAG